MTGKESVGCKHPKKLPVARHPKELPIARHPKKLPIARHPKELPVAVLKVAVLNVVASGG